MDVKLSLSWNLLDYANMMREICKIPSINSLIRFKESVYSTHGYHLIPTQNIDKLDIIKENQDLFLKKRNCKNPGLKPKPGPSGDNYQVFNLINASNRPVSIRGF
jgi:hypothetical protein